MTCGYAAHGHRDTSEWDEVMAVVKQAVDVVATRYPRVGIVLKADIRPGHEGQLSAKVERVEEHLRER